VVLRIPFRATHRGEFFGIAPTGKQINVTKMLIARIADGKIVEMWEENVCFMLPS
jgi:predicted ester cyclase